MNGTFRKPLDITEEAWAEMVKFNSLQHDIEQENLRKKKEN
jgi:hypothetical protein